ncbi:MAG: hypothetical protein FH762_06705 [Firmicutes bacterium]|nr:hypothetical protein [Bacillota bacterium]
MAKETDFITDDLARRIYNRLADNDNGFIPYPDFKLKYHLAQRAENNKPELVSIKVINESGDSIGSYNLKYGEGFSDYTVE